MEEGYRKTNLVLVQNLVISSHSFLEFCSYLCSVSGHLGWKHRLENWNKTAVDINMADIAAAVERADLASREDSSVSYAEVVKWRLTEADESEFVLTLDDEGLHLDHPENELDRDVSISATGSGTYDGRIDLSGTTEIWVVYDNGVTYLTTTRPDF